jgi:hypothetical protein
MNRSNGANDKTLLQAACPQIKCIFAAAARQPGRAARVAR